MSSSPLCFHTDGLTAWVDSVAVHPTTHEVTALSLFGTHTRLRAIRAQLALQMPFSIESFEELKWPKPELRPFRAFTTTLSASTAACLWLPHQAIPLLLNRHQPALLFDTSLEPPTPPRQFFPLLNHLLPCPLLPQWATSLWHWGIDAQWIRPLRTHGLQAWELAPDSQACLEWIQRHLRNHHLPVAPAHSQNTPIS